MMKSYGKKILCAYGGGSVIDASKPITCSACYKGDSWELMMDRSLMTKALPIFDVLTISTTGLEVRLSPTKKLMKNWKSLRLCYIRQFPFVFIPYTMALPASQTAEGCANIDSLCFRRRCRIQKIMKLVQISCGILR